MDSTLNTTEATERLIASKSPSLAQSFLQQHARWWMTAALLLSDLLNLLLAGLLSVALRVVFEEYWHYELFWQVIPVALVCLCAYALRGLYPGIGIGPVVELQCLTSTTSIVVLSLAGLTFFTRNPEDYSRLTLGLTWVFSLGLVPLGRAFTRAVGVRLNAWGEPVVVIGYGQQGRWLIQFLRRDRKIGLNPVLVLDGFGKNDKQSEGIPVLPMNTELFDYDLLGSTGIESAVLIPSEVPQDWLTEFEMSKEKAFRRLILIPDLAEVSSLGVTPLNLGRILGLEVHHNLFSKGQQMVKRVMDVVLVLVGGLLISPLFIFITLMIHLDTKGSTFYAHTRVGKRGRKLKVWKFRTMIQNADQKLDQYLAEKPGLRTEWEAEQKIKYDPRITRMGKFLRKFSLDELPQLWNVIIGEMSLVGPRPIVNEEICRYAERFDLYKQVKPGITGLWQVSGRNDTTYEERVRLDEYYVRNWSIWLDIYIIARTFTVLISREGAY